MLPEKLPTIRRGEQRARLFSLSPWLLAIACLLLGVLIVFFGISNYQREKVLLRDLLVQRSLTLTRFISSAARESMREYWRYSGKIGRWEDFMQAAVSQATEQPGVVSALVVAGDGRILAGSGEDVEKGIVDGKLLAFLAKVGAGSHTGRDLFPPHNRPEPDRQGRNFREKEYAVGLDGGSFLFAVEYLPPGVGRMLGGQGWMGMHQMMNRGRGLRNHPINDELERISRLHPVLLVRLDSSRFSTPLRRQFLQVAILASVALLVGCGAALSLATLKALRGSENRLGSIRAFSDRVVTALPLGLIVIDQDGRIRVCNPVAADLLGTSVEQVTGQEGGRVLPSDWQEYTAKDESSLVEQELEWETGDCSRNLELSIQPVTVGEDGATGKLLLIRDISKIRRLEQELRRTEKLAALGKVAAGVAHELRNPLSSIKGLAALLGSPDGSAEEMQQTSAMLVGEVERLNRSISELLDYARPMSLHREMGYLYPLLEKTISLLELDASVQGVEMVLEGEDEKSMISFDRDKLSQVFLNLLLNSVQSMEGNSGRIVVRLESEGKRRRVVILDNGCGISAEDLPRIFDPYFTTKSDGTGLGLAMSAKIVEEHGGRIRVTSEPGNGTEVEVFL